MVIGRIKTGKFSNHDFFLKKNFSQESIDSVEFLNQNGILNSEGSFGEWTFGTRYPIYVQESSILSYGEYVYVFGK